MLTINECPQTPLLFYSCGNNHELLYANPFQNQYSSSTSVANLIIRIKA